MPACEKVDGVCELINADVRAAQPACPSFCCGEGLTAVEHPTVVEDDHLARLKSMGPSFTLDNLIAKQSILRGSKRTVRTFTRAGLRG